MRRGSGQGRVWWGLATTNPDETAIKQGDSHAEMLLPSERINPQTKADAGAQIGPTEAMPSVAKQRSIRLPMW